MYVLTSIRTKSMLYDYPEPCLHNMIILDLYLLNIWLFRILSILYNQLEPSLYYVTIQNLLYKLEPSIEIIIQPLLPASKHQKSAMYMMVILENTVQTTHNLIPLKFIIRTNLHDMFALNSFTTLNLMTICITV